MESSQSTLPNHMDTLNKPTTKPLKDAPRLVSPPPSETRDETTESDCSDIKHRRRKASVMYMALLSSRNSVLNTPKDMSLNRLGTRLPTYSGFMSSPVPEGHHVSDSPADLMPNSVLNHIMSYVPLSDLVRTCLYVNSRWSNSAVKYIYTRPRIFNAKQFHIFMSLIENTWTFHPYMSSLQGLALGSEVLETVLPGDIVQLFSLLFESAKHNFSSHLKGLILDQSHGVTNSLVCSIVDYTPKLTQLFLSGNPGITDATVSYVIQQCHDLQEMDLSGTSVTLLSLWNILSPAAWLPPSNESTIASSSSSPVLGTSRQRHSRPFSLYQSRSYSDQIHVPMKCKLQKLWIDGAASESSSKLSFDVNGTSSSSCCLTLQFLSLKDSGITDIGLRYVANRCPNLTDLVLDASAGISDDGVVGIVMACPDLKRFDASFCPLLTDLSLLAIAGHGKELVRLSISAIDGVSERGILSVIQGCLELQEVHCHGCPQILSSFLKDYHVGPRRLGIECAFQGRMIHLLREIGKPILRPLLPSRVSHLQDHPSHQCKALSLSTRDMGVQTIPQKFFEMRDPVETHHSVSATQVEVAVQVSVSNEQVPIQGQTLEVKSVASSATKLPSPAITISAHSENGPENVSHSQPTDELKKNDNDSSKLIPVQKKASRAIQRLSLKEPIGLAVLAAEIEADRRRSSVSSKEDIHEQGSSRSSKNVAVPGASTADKSCESVASEEKSTTGTAQPSSRDIRHISRYDTVARQRSLNVSTSKSQILSRDHATGNEPNQTESYPAIETSDIQNQDTISSITVGPSPASARTSSVASASSNGGGTVLKHFPISKVHESGSAAPTDPSPSPFPSPASTNASDINDLDNRTGVSLAKESAEATESVNPESMPAPCTTSVSKVIVHSVTPGEPDFHSPSSIRLSPRQSDVSLLRTTSNHRGSMPIRKRDNIISSNATPLDPNPSMVRHTRSKSVGYLPSVSILKSAMSLPDSVTPIGRSQSSSAQIASHQAPSIVKSKSSGVLLKKDNEEATIDYGEFEQDIIATIEMLGQSSPKIETIDPRPEPLDTATTTRVNLEKETVPLVTPPPRPQAPKILFDPPVVAVEIPELTSTASLDQDEQLKAKPVKSRKFGRRGIHALAAAEGLLSDRVDEPEEENAPTKKGMKKFRKRGIHAAAAAEAARSQTYSHSGYDDSEPEQEENHDQPVMPSQPSSISPLAGPSRRTRLSLTKSKPPPLLSRTIELGGFPTTRAGTDESRPLLPPKDTKKGEESHDESDDDRPLGTLSRVKKNSHTQEILRNHHFHPDRRNLSLSRNHD